MNAVGWFDIYFADMERAKAFYEAVFATSLKNISTGDESVEMWAFDPEMTNYGAGGALTKMEGGTPGPGGTLIYFSCVDCAVEEARVSENGGQVFRPKFSIGNFGFISIAQDTEGNVIGLHSMK